MSDSLDSFPDGTSDALLRRAVAGDSEALDALFADHRERLLAMVRLRMNRQLQGRVDASDVIQDAYAEAARVLADYLDNPTLPFYLWLRHITQQQLIIAHRRHLGAKKRDAQREVRFQPPAGGEVSTHSLVDQLTGRVSSPSQSVMRAELRAKLYEVLDKLDPLDREVLALRHFEQLSNAEAAAILQITPAATSKRHVRALERLRGIMASISEVDGGH